jgi:hypothetical protein
MVATQAKCKGLGAQNQPEHLKFPELKNVSINIFVVDRALGRGQ